MVFPIVGGDGKPTGYEISNSLRFNDGDSPALSRTPSSTGNRRTFTISAWVKRCKDDNVDEGIFNAMVEPYDGQNRFVFGITSAGELNIYNRTGGTTYSLASTDLLRDPSAWYHCVCIIDSTDSTEADRQRMYLNGRRITSFADNSPISSQNAETAVSRNDAKHAVGDKQWTSDHFDGYIAEHYYLDGVAYEPTYFAETNDNGVWVPKQYTGGNFGTNGHFLQFKQTGTSTNSSGMGADTSGNDNHYAVANLAATDVTTDTPTNNFATMNPVHVSIYGTNGLATFSEGNLKIGMNSDSSTSSTIAPSKGKWYVEYKQSENTADNQGFPTVGISATLGGNAGDTIGFRTPSGTNYRGQLGTSSVDNVFLSAREANDIFGFYIDLDNSKLIVHKNGSNYMNTGYTGGLDWSGGLTTTNEQTGFYHFYVQNNSDGSPRYTDEVNFGNPTFSISSSNSDANGYGSFEYSPTLSGTDYYAMCTKNLAEYG